MLFLHVLEADEADAFVDAAWHLIHTDGDVDEREEVLLAELQTELGMDPRPHSGMGEAKVLEVLGRLEEPIVRRVVLLELVGISVADGHVHESERTFLQLAARALDMPHEMIDTYVDFAFRAQGIWAEGRSLVIDEEG